EGGHDAVAFVLVDGAAVPEDERLEDGEAAVHDLDHVLGIHPLRHGREARDVGEENARVPSLAVHALPARARGLSGRAAPWSSSSEFEKFDIPAQVREGFSACGACAVFSCYSRPCPPQCSTACPSPRRRSARWGGSPSSRSWWRSALRAATPRRSSSPGSGPWSRPTPWATGSRGPCRPTTSSLS